MSYVTSAELAEIAPDLRNMAERETSAEVQAALLRLADRYASLVAECEAPTQASNTQVLAA